MRRSICFLLAAMAVLSSCSTYLESTTAAKFQDGIYYKASKSPKTSSDGGNAVASSVTYSSPSATVSFGVGVSYGYPFWTDNWYWNRSWSPWSPWYPWDPWYPYGPYRPWDPWGPWGPWGPYPWRPYPIVIRDPNTIWTTRDPRSGGGVYSFGSSGAGTRNVRYVAPSSGGSYGRSLDVGGSGTRIRGVTSTPASTSVNRNVSVSAPERAYGRDVSGVGTRQQTAPENVRRSAAPAGYQGGGFSGGTSSPGMSQGGGFSGGMSSHGGSAGRRR